MNKTITPIVIFFTLLTATNVYSNIPIVDVALGNARVYSSANQITASTGKVERVWQWTGNGLGTVSLKNLTTDKQWISSPEANSDWMYYNITEGQKGIILDLRVEKVDANVLHNAHIKMVTEVFYPDVKATVLHQADIYPDAPGIRTQLGIKQPPKVVAPIKIDKTKVNIKAVNGSIYIPEDFHDETSLAFATMLSSSSIIRFEVSNIRFDKSYVIGLSWWDWNGMGRQQEVRVVSADGKNFAVAIPTTNLPDYKNKKDKPDILISKVPGDVLYDDSFIIEIEKKAGANAVVSEIWIYELQGKNPLKRSEIPRDRAEEVYRKAPKDYVLAAYLDAGERSYRSRDYKLSTGISERLNIELRDGVINFSGYNAINAEFSATEEPLLKQEDIQIKYDTSKYIEWANIASFISGEDGIAMVKESNKCSNVESFDTGAFSVGPSGISSTGWGIRTFEIPSTECRKGWANWTILSSGKEDGMMLAIKQFDRAVFPFNKVLGLYSAVQTGTPEGEKHVSEDYVLKKMEQAFDSNLDFVFINQGWEIKPEKQIIGRSIWTPETDYYPSGWQPIFEQMLKQNLRTSLSANYSITNNELLKNFTGLRNSLCEIKNIKIREYSELEDFNKFASKYISDTMGTSFFSMETATESPSVGYYLARQYGNVYLGSRNIAGDNSKRYLALRDIWELTKYANPDKWQLPVEAVEGNSVCQSIATIVGLPIFTDKLKNIQANSDFDRLIGAFEKHKANLQDMFVFPIGKSPDGSSWTGFQFYCPGSKDGYLLIIREPENLYNTYKMRLKFTDCSEISLTNLLTEESKNVTCESGFVDFAIESQGGFIFASYSEK